MRFLSNLLAKAGLIVDGTTTLNGVAGASVDTDKFVVLDGSVVKYRTGEQLLRDISSGLTTDYDYSITGLRNSSNKIFTLSQNFVSGTTRVFVNGIRYTLGGSYDYTETGTNQITFTNAPDSGDLIVVDYVKA
jgi:hypothetical protein